MHRTLVDMARSMLFNSKMPVPFWGEAVHYACYVHNRVPTSSNSGQKSPIEALTGKIPKIADIVAFGSKCTVAVENKKGQAWNPRAMEGYIIGLSEEVKGYKVYVPKTGKTVITQHVKNFKRSHKNRTRASCKYGRLKEKNSRNQDQAIGTQMRLERKEM
jgi:hypothetical protein